MLGQPWILQLKQDYNISVEAGFRIGEHMESSMPLSEYNFGKFTNDQVKQSRLGPYFLHHSAVHYTVNHLLLTEALLHQTPHCDSLSPPIPHWPPSVFFTASVFSFWPLNTTVPWSSVLGPLRFSIHSHCLYQAERWSPKRLVCFLIPGNCGFYFILQKSEYYLILPKMWLRILRGVYLGLPRWTLNLVTSVLIRKSQRYPTDRRGGSNVAL